MTTDTATPTTTAAPQASAKSVSSVVAVYRHHTDAEDAVHRLERAGIPMQKISIIGRNFELREDVQGYYRPSYAALEGAGALAAMDAHFRIWDEESSKVLSARGQRAPETLRIPKTA